MKSKPAVQDFDNSDRIKSSTNNFHQNDLKLMSDRDQGNDSIERFYGYTDENKKKGTLPEKQIKKKRRNIEIRKPSTD